MTLISAAAAVAVTDPARRPQTPPQTFALSSAQRDIWLDQQSRGDSPLYNIGGYVELRGPLDPALMRHAIEVLVAKNDALRTRLSPGPDGLPLQTFPQSVPVEVPLHDFSERPDPHVAAQALMQQQMEQAYALHDGPLFRFFLLRLDERHHLLGTQAHHLILDGWGFGQMLQSLGEIYSALERQQPIDSVAPSYIDFILDDARYHGSPRHARDRAYWLDKFHTLPEPLLSPRYRERNGTLAARSSNLVLAFPTALHQRMKQLGGACQASAFHVLLAALQVYFCRSAQRDEWVVGLPLLNRSNARFKSTLGLFTQVSAVRFPVDQGLSFSAQVRATSEVLKQDFRHQRFPLSEMNRALGLLREDRAQLFDVSVSYEKEDHDYRYGEALAQSVKVSNNHEPMPLAIHLRSNACNDQTWVHYVYNEAYFQRAEVEALAQRLIYILEQGLENPRLTLADFSLSTPAETALLQQWNSTEQAFGDKSTLHQRIEARAAEHPHAVAALYQGQSLTYAELNQRANSLAHHLLELGVEPDDRVAIVARRGLETLIGLLAILKSGGCYVPIDPAHPAERLHYLLSDCAPVALLTQAALRAHLPALDVPIINLDHAAWTHHNAHNPQVDGLSAANLAYVIYTSGSTGLPKGVMVEHRSVSNLLEWHCRAFDLCLGRHTSSVAGFGFDAMAWEVWPALCVGATLHLPPAHDGNEDIDALLEWWREQPLDVSFLPTPVAEYAFSQNRSHPTLRTLLIGGDRLRQFSRAQTFDVINNYGPTEATVVATSGRVEVGHDLHIGQPIANATIYLLDEQQRPVPIGVAGELYVGGAGVARGYLNRAELSAERFLSDPFSSAAHARMYRTGDLARWSAQGNIEYLGRNDDQVKIRGMRIELGEIEPALGTFRAVKEAVVQLLDGRLVAWFTEFRTLAIEDLHAHLQARLPDYMVPSAYVRLDSLPLTANGKLDRKALPAPDASALRSREYVAPQGPVENTLAQIWAEVLNVERVGRHDHFFELGGHSLLAVVLIERMRQVRLSADVRVLFSQPTLAALAGAIGSGREIEVPANLIAPGCQSISPQLLPLLTLDQPSIDRVVASVPGGVGNVQDIYPLAPSQEGVLYHHITAQQGDPYLLNAQLAFDSIERLQAFAQALQTVIDRHDILRTAVLWEGFSQPLQVVRRAAVLPLQQIILDPRDDDVLGQLHARFDARHYRLDLAQAPLIQLMYAPDPRNARVVAVLLFHHIVMDHTALDVLRAEIHASLRGHGEPLDAPMPYRNYVAQARLGVSEAEHEAFFREMLGDVDEPTLPFGLQRVHGDIEEATQTLPNALSVRLRSQARVLGVSAASLFHLAWARLLGAASGNDTVVFGTVLLGRMHAGDGADRALGMFINTLPLRVDVGETGVRDGVKATHARLTALLAHEHASLALAQRCSGVAPALPLFSAMLNYRHSDSTLQQQTAWEGIEILASDERTNFPLTLSVDDLGEDFLLTARTPAQIGAQRIGDSLRVTLESLVQALEHTPQRALNRLPILTPQERQHLLTELNATEVDWPLEQTIQAIFEAQVLRTPDAVALVAGEQSLTYAELNARANQLAAHLREHGVVPDARVAICVERGLELVIGLWAILKAGGAYVPLDPGYPPERIAFMLRDCAPVALLIHGATRGLLPDIGVPLIDFDHNIWQGQSPSNPQVPGLNASHLAYMIYTSGSTGTPKGVMLEHRGLNNLVLWSSQLIPHSQNGALLQKAPFSFDGSVWEFFWPLTVGMRLVLARPDGHREPAYLAQQVHKQHITVIKFVPAMLQQFLELADIRLCGSLTDVVCGGGELTAELARQVQKRLPAVRLHNVYGPTEATVDSSAWTLEPGAAIPDIQLPIGRAIANTRLYLLDAHDLPVPFGVTGHLHIGGVGVARGYRGLAQLTAERFTASPFVPGDRLYRTGDLARYLPDGSLQFLGRDDFQVKLRGLRVELGEIEARLASHPALKEVAVLMRDERLVAYYTLTTAAQMPAIEELRGYLLRLLPDYMVPSAYVVLDSLPLSPNGKLDRRALPAPGVDAVLARDYEAPLGPVENALAAIWSEVLKIERVGRHDHFFELGGHSLLAVNLVARMREAGLNADARALFSEPTLAALAAKTVEHVQPLAIPETTIPTLQRKRRL
ncbi:amino acid adenylation domain-containing protein [Pseudomonas prosekii]|uniref:amino acid adenylation domain-containing protein n=1 Tax=Pseudomonas prosekii TaxID=1148509 RepID=UPI00387B4C53